LVHDPALRAGVEKALRVSQAEYGSSWNKKNLSVTIMVDDVPVGIGYDVFARIRGKEKKIGAFSCPRGTKNHGWSCGADVDPFADPRIDLILKPSLEAVLGTIDTFETLDEVIVIKDVAVKRNANAATMPVSAPTSAPTSMPTTTASGTAPR
jgi:hypothetical protein